MPPKLLHVGAQVLDNHRFEPESRRVQVREQLTRGCSQSRSSQRRINKVNLRGGANSSLRAYLWRPRVLFLDKENTFQRTDVPANGTRLNITHASHIRRDRCQLQLGRQVARQRAQQGCHCSWVTARFIIQARNVTDSNILKVRAQITLGVLLYHIKVCGPPSMHEGRKHCGNIHRRGESRGGQITVKEAPERDSSDSEPTLFESHRAHPQTHESVCTGVSHRILSGNR